MFFWYLRSRSVRPEVGAGVEFVKADIKNATLLAEIFRNLPLFSLRAKRGGTGLVALPSAVPLRGFAPLGSPRMSHCAVGPLGLSRTLLLLARTISTSANCQHTMRTYRMIADFSQLSSFLITFGQYPSLLLPVSRCAWTERVSVQLSVASF